MDWQKRPELWTALLEHYVQGLFGSALQFGDGLGFLHHAEFGIEAGGDGMLAQ